MNRLTLYIGAFALIALAGMGFLIKWQYSTIQDLKTSKPFWRPNMLKLSKWAIVMRIAPVCLLIPITGCALWQEPQTSEITVSPSAEFLYDLAHEHNTREYGDATESVVNDWIAMYEPDYEN